VLLAAKKLAEVEVSAESSNQHEFNAGLLRKALDLPTDVQDESLDIVYLSDDGDDPEVESARYTLYNAREGKPRAAEYRLYYKSPLLQARAAAGDLLVIARLPSSLALRALVVPAESELGLSVRAALSDEGLEIDDRFRLIQANIGKQGLEHLLAGASETVDVPDANEAIPQIEPLLLAKAIESRRMPSTTEMAAEALRILSVRWPMRMSADDALYWALAIETAIFHHIEERIGQVELDALMKDGRVPFGDAFTLVMRQIQSRKSRRGHSLQHHFGKILLDAGIPHAAQCVTEGKERPDFVIPGHAAYHDAAFPADRLRMVACKSVVKERWRQILTEANRIPHKYLLTLDPKLTTDTIAAMRQSAVEIFVPRPTLESSYANFSGAEPLRVVDELVDELREVSRD
jgi:hypothetical protein